LTVVSSCTFISHFIIFLAFLESWMAQPFLRKVFFPPEFSHYVLYTFNLVMVKLLSRSPLLIQQHQFRVPLSLHRFQFDTTSRVAHGHFLPTTRRCICIPLQLFWVYFGDIKKRATLFRTVPAPSTHLHEESFTLQIIQQAILNGGIFGYGRKAIYLHVTSQWVLGSSILFDSFSGYWLQLNEQNVLVTHCLFFVDLPLGISGLPFVWKRVHLREVLTSTWKSLRVNKVRKYFCAVILQA
jgi:hypothetical protein